MKSKMRQFLMLVALGLGVMMPLTMAFADSDHQGQSRDSVTSESLKQLSAEWWQWVYSLPSSVNPVLDETGANCVVGQRGDVWFLAGTFLPGPATRTCSVPDGKVLFFPVINSSQFNSPNECGQGPGSLTVKEMRSAAAPFIDAATISVTLNGRPVRNIQRVRSEVFEVSLPTDNIYVFFGVTPCDGGVYSPAVDDGYYAHLDSLPARAHPYELHIQAESGAFGVDVTYNLTVVPVIPK